MIPPVAELAFKPDSLELVGVIDRHGSNTRTEASRNRIGCIVIGLNIGVGDRLFETGIDRLDC